MAFVLTRIGGRLAKYLSTPRRQASQVATVSPELLAATLRPGDVLLVDWAADPPTLTPATP